MRKLICLVAFVSTCGFGFQAYQSHSLATLLGFLGSFVVFLTAIANLKSEGKKNASVSQSIGKNSSGIQIGGNISINEKDKK